MTRSLWAVHHTLFELSVIALRFVCIVMLEALNQESCPIVHVAKRIQNQFEQKGRAPTTVSVFFFAPTFQK